MMGRMTLREVREALAAAKAKGAKASAAAPTVEELESLARLLEREAKEGVAAEEPHGEGAAEQGVALDRAGMMLVRDVTFLAAGPASERSRSAKKHSAGNWYCWWLVRRADHYVTWRARMADPLRPRHALVPIG